MFTPALGVNTTGARDGETCATPASARGALTATLRHPSSFVFATPVTARHDAPAFTPQTRAFQRENAATELGVGLGSPMALDVSRETAASEAAAARAPARAFSDPHAQWHTPAPRVSTSGSTALTSDGEIVFGRIPRHDGRAPKPKRDAIVVFGDVGTSHPRQRDAKAFARGSAAFEAETHVARDETSDDANVRLSSSSSSSSGATARVGARTDALEPPRTIRVAAHCVLATLEEEPEDAEGVRAAGGAVVARQLFDEASTLPGAWKRGAPDGAPRNKAARSSLAMRSPRKPSVSARAPPSPPRRTISSAPARDGTLPPICSRLGRARDVDGRDVEAEKSFRASDFSATAALDGSFAEPASTLPAFATEAPSAPGFGTARGGAPGRPAPRTASRVGRLLLERELGGGDDACEGKTSSSRPSVYASPFATARELLGYGEPHGDEDDATGERLGGVEGFVEAFESGNGAFAGSVAAGFEFGGEHKGGLPASRLEDRFASLGLGLAAKR